MSPSNERSRLFAELSIELSAACLDAIESDSVDELSNDHLGQVFASMLRVFAAKAQDGECVKPFGRNSNVTATDVAIGCTAMLDAVGLALFELGAWQSMSNVGRKPVERSSAT